MQEVDDTDTRFRKRCLNGGVYMLSIITVLPEDAGTVVGILKNEQGDLTHVDFEVTVCG